MKYEMEITIKLPMVVNAVSDKEAVKLVEYELADKNWGEKDFTIRIVSKTKGGGK